MVAQTNHQITKCAMEIKFDTGDLFTNGENHQGKISLGDFKVTTSENSLLSQQVVINKEISSTLPTYS